MPGPRDCTQAISDVSGIVIKERWTHVKHGRHPS